jgi:hypothetical protein
VVGLLALLALGSVTTGARANQGVYATWWNAKDTSDDGLGIGFRSKVPINPLLAFDTRVGWVRFSDESMNLIPLEATGLLKLGMAYAGVGGGYYIFNGADVKNNFGWYALGGIDVSVKSLGIFGEAKWNSLSTDFDSPPPGAGNPSLDAGGWSINLGVMFDVPKK